MLKKTGLFRGMAIGAVMLLSVSIGTASALEANRGMVDQVLGTVSEQMVSDDDGTLWSTHVPDEE